MGVHATIRRAARLAALAAVVVLGACSRGEPLPAPPAPEVAVIAARRESVPLTVELPGRTSAFRVAQVRARVDGIVRKRDFKEGSDVKAGERLYQIDPAPFRAALDSATAALEQARATSVSATALAERDKILVGGNAVSRQDYDNAVAAQRVAAANVAAAEAAVTTARINLGYTDVVAPIPGRAGISQVTEGAYVQAAAATLMTAVQQIDPIYVDLTQSSVEGLRLRRDVAAGRLKLNGPGEARVTLFLEDGSQYPATGTLQFTDITVDPSTGSVTVRAVFPNPRHVLLPGMYVRARIAEGTNEGAMLIPEVGVTHDASGQATALVVGPDDTVAERAIQATRTLGASWVVEGGVAEGERVIVAGGQKVRPGMRVRAVAWQAPRPAAPPPAQGAGAPPEKRADPPPAAQ